ncbi:MAG: glycosyltransferase family 4 protein [Anaerolineae bacterium]|nr:glycosyltransferase family 4 protein [Anaerolineae bacterium]
MKRTLYVYNVRAKFVAIDEEILRERYDVRAAYVTRRHPSLFTEMWRQARDIDLVVAWFASWHSLPAFAVARLRNIPRLLISGGYDTADEPGIGYGLRQGGLPRLISGLTFRLADRAFMLSHYSYHEALSNTPLKAENMVVVPLGVPDASAFSQPVEKEDIALTIGNIDAVNAYRKGIRPFVDAARLCPDVPFVVVGKARDDYIHELRRSASPNVEFTGYVTDAELISLQQRAKVYVQASQHEGFGLALAESMLARCVPVTTCRGALPEVVGETGVFLDDVAPETVAGAIREAFSMTPEAGARARAHILEHFPLEARKHAIHAEVDRLAGLI